VRSVEALWHTMLVQLVAQLRTDLQLPKCLQIVGYLRRMQAFGDNELRLKFLQARDAWLTSCLEAIPTGDGKPALDLRRKLFWIMIRNNLYFASIIFNVGIEKRCNHFIYIASLLSH